MAVAGVIPACAGNRIEHLDRWEWLTGHPCVCGNSFMLPSGKVSIAGHPCVCGEQQRS